MASRSDHSEVTPSLGGAWSELLRLGEDSLSTPRGCLSAWLPRGIPGTLLFPQEERDTEKRELGQGQKQRQQALSAAGTQGPANSRRGFMKCLLEVEEQEEATHRRTLKSRGLTARRSPKTVTSVSTSGPISSSVPTLPLTLHEPSTSAPASVPSWVRPPAPGQTPIPMGSPGSVLPTSAQDQNWRWPEFLPQGNERTLTYAKILR